MKSTHLVVALACLLAGFVLGWFGKGWSADAAYQSRKAEIYYGHAKLQKDIGEFQKAWQAWYSQKREADSLKRVRVPDAEK